MEILNKKTIISVFFGCVLLQAVFILAFSANSLLALAQMSPTFSIAARTENNTTNISGNANFYATSSSPDSTAVLSGLGFYFFPVTPSGGSYYGFTGTSTDGINWSANIDTAFWPSGSYDYYAKGYYGAYTYDNTPYISNHTTININNSSNVQALTIQFVNNPPMPFSGETTLYVETSETVDSVQFKVISNSGSYTTYYGASGNNNQYHFIWPTANFANDSYTIKAMAYKSGYETAYAHIYGATVNNTTTTTIPLTISLYENYSASAISGVKTIYALPNKEVSSVKFNVAPSNGGTGILFTGTKDGSSNKYYFNWDTTTFANNSYMLMATAYGISASEIAETKLNNIQINNSTAIPTIPTFTINAGIEGITASGQTINGTKSFWANSASSDSTSVLSNLDFMLKDSGNSYAHIATATTTDYKNWSGSWNSANIADGNYDFFAEGKYKKTDGTYAIYKSGFTNINIGNGTTAALIINFSENYSGSAVSGAKTIYAETNKTADLVEFKITSSSGLATSYKGIKDASSNKYYFIWNTTAFADDIYKLEATAYAKAETAFAPLHKVKVSNGITTFPLTISFAEDYSASAISGIKTIYALPNKDVNAVEFKVISNTGVVAPFAGIKDSSSSNKYYFIWNTTTLAKGYYTLKATANSMTETAFSYLYNVAINNDSGATASLGAEFVNVLSMPLVGDNKIQIKTNLEPTSVKFEVKGIKYAAFSATKIDANNYYFLWKTAEFPNGDYLVYAFIEKGMDKIDRYIKTGTNNPSTNPAEPQIAPLTVTFVEKFTPPISGDQKISISANREIYSCTFKIEGPRFAEITGIKDNSTQCHILLRTSDFPNGDYVIRAIASRDSALAENKLSTRIENWINPAEPAPMPIEPVPANIPQECKDKGLLTPEECQNYMQFPFECRQQNILDPAKCKEYMFRYVMPPECVNQEAATQEECSGIIFTNSLPSECREQGITAKEECDRILSAQLRLTLECKNANIATVEECDKYMMENFMPPECQKQGATTREECDYILRNAYSNLKGLTGFETEPTSSLIRPIEKVLTSECSKAGIASLEECEKHMMLLKMPAECREANVTNSKECEKIMFKKFGPPECVEAQIFQPEECEKLMFKKYAPEDCRKAGILNPEACKKYMFEKYNGKENIPQDKFPIECQKANAGSIDECEKIMKKIYTPKECEEQGIDDEQKCDFYLKQKHMPQECLEAEAKSSEECDKIMFKKFGPPECQKAGIDDEKECQEFMFNKYAPRVKCDNLEDWQCKNLVKEKHLGNIVAKQAQFDKIKEKSVEIIGKSIELKELELEIFQEKKMTPLVKENTKLKIVEAAENLVLNEENSLIQTAPVALLIDTDKDGLSDDLETRLGTDPSNADSDRDGYNDGEEVKNGFNPFGEGKLEKEIAPIEEAIIQNKTLGHPKIEGEEKENLAVESIANAEGKEGNLNEGYILSGKSEPNSVATLYIYSDLPLVVTVKTDEYGNWEYKLDQSLTDGEHEIYVAINDNTGKVVDKSKPLNFFIREARSVSVKDFVAPVASAASQIPKESENSIRYYLIVAFVSIIIGISLFIAVIASRKKGQAVK